MKNLKTARATILERLQALDVSTLDISDYNKRYMGDIILNAERFLESQATLLERALAGNTKPLADTVVVDIGSGTGVFSFLALEAGVGTVVANDIYDVSCRDAAVIGEAVGTPLNHVVEGDIDEVIAHLKANGLQPDAFVSYDVIEHIYDVPEHLKKLRSIAAPGTRVVYASTANIANPKRVKAITEVQAMVETQPREAKWGHKERDALDSYLSMRRSMITKLAPELDEAALDQLAHDTRGLAGEDITNAVNQFKASGSISHRMSHPTNTCDPATGNWCEHLFEFDELTSMSKAAGFATARVDPGPYNTCGAVHKRLAKHGLNLWISTLGGRSGARWAPYYILIAEA